MGYFLRRISNSTSSRQQRELCVRMEHAIVECCGNGLRFGGTVLAICRDDEADAVAAERPVSGVLAADCAVLCRWLHHPWPHSPAGRLRSSAPINMPN